MSRYTNYYETYPKDGLGDYSLFIDATLLLISTAWLGTAGLVGFALFKTLKNSNKTLSSKINNSKEKEIIIVRGVPGIGKDKYVYYNEVGEDGNFTVCSSDNYFYENEKYHFNRKKINQSESFCLQQFHQSLKLNVSRVYVTNVNHQKWIYSNYVKLAESYKYKVRVLTILCEDEDQLRYFNSRSKHNVPMNFSKKVFEDWEYDQNETFIEPYIGNEEGYLEGDCLPFPQRSEEELNKELEDYHSRRCLVESEQEGQIVNDSDEAEVEPEDESEVEPEDESEDEPEDEPEDDSEDEPEDEPEEEFENSNIITIINHEDIEIIDQRNIILKTNYEDNKLTILRADKSESEVLDVNGLSGYLL